MNEDNGNGKTLDGELRKRAIPERSVDSDILYKELLKVPIGEVVTYEQLSARIGRDVRTDARGNLTTARRAALTIDRALFSCVHRVGLKRLDDMGKLDAGESQLQRVRKASQNGRRMLSSVLEFDALPNEQKVRHNATASVLGAIHAFSKPSALAKVAGRVKELSDGTLPVAKTIEMFGGK